jgi:hypothetical protein
MDDSGKTEKAHGRRLIRRQRQDSIPKESGAEAWAAAQGMGTVMQVARVFALQQSLLTR